MDCPSEIRELLKVLYNLNASEAEVFYYLCDKEGRVSEIAGDLNKDRSTVQRYLSKLRSAGLVKRRGEIDEGKKGKYFVYKTLDEDELKEKIKSGLDEWVEGKKDTIDSI